jgi:repressor LexA
MSKLTKRQQEILQLIQSHMNETGSPPTRAEIAKTMGFRSPNAAEDHLRALARKGVIELVPGTSRGIRLTQQFGIPIISSNIHLNKNAALFEESNDKTSRIERNFFQPPIDFLVRIEDNHLQSQGILAGDYLAVHHQNNTPTKTGQLMVIRSNNGISIQPQTSEGLSHNATLEGIVVGVIRSLTNAKLT